MKVWQSILKDHHNVEVLDGTKAIVKNVIYDTINNVILDDTITRIPEGYTDSEGHLYESIYDYLGY